MGWEGICVWGDGDRQKHQGVIGCGHMEVRGSKDYTGVSNPGDQQGNAPCH